jgi:acyl dehydratase
MPHARVFRDPQPRSYEDFADGISVRTRARTVESSDILRFAELVGNYYPLHIDAEAARDTRFGQRLAHGSLILSIAIGLFESTGVFGDAVVAMLGMTDIVATAPVHPGQTIHAEVLITPRPLSADARHGVLDLDYSVRRESGEVVMTFRQTVLVRRAVRP